MNGEGFEVILDPGLEGVVWEGGVREPEGYLEEGGYWDVGRSVEEGVEERGWEETPWAGPVFCV